MISLRACKGYEGLLQAQCRTVSEDFSRRCAGLEQQQRTAHELQEEAAASQKAQLELMEQRAAAKAQLELMEQRAQLVPWAQQSSSSQQLLLAPQT